jgi:hypothetical protein
LQSFKWVAKSLITRQLFVLNISPSPTKQITSPVSNLIFFSSTAVELLTEKSNEGKTNQNEGNNILREKNKNRN